MSSDCICSIFFFQAEDGIRDLVRSRGLGDVYKRQAHSNIMNSSFFIVNSQSCLACYSGPKGMATDSYNCLLYTSDAADERSSVDLGGRRIIKKKNNVTIAGCRIYNKNNHSR